MKNLKKQLKFIFLLSLVTGALYGGIAFYIDNLYHYWFHSYFEKRSMLWFTEITYDDMISTLRIFMSMSASFFYTLVLTFPLIIVISRLKYFKPVGDKIDKFLQPIWEKIINQSKHVKITVISIVAAIYLPLEVYWLVENFKKIVFPVPVHVIFLLSVMLISTFSMMYLKRRHQMLILFCTCLMFVPWSFMFANEVTNVRAEEVSEEKYRLNFECYGETVGKDPHDFLFFRGQHVIIMGNSKTGQFKKYDTNKVSKEVLIPARAR